MNKRFCTFWAVTLVVMSSSLSPASAQEAPPPQRMPRVPVTHQLLSDSRDSTFSRQVAGPAAIIDGEKLRIGDADLRLFGIVPPQLAASFGPQARSALDALANGQNVSCQIRDRDRDGRLLATCSNSTGADMALELLKKGLAVTARGSLTGTELAQPYMAAEQNAQNQKIGLWSTAAFSSVMAANPAGSVAASSKELAPGSTPAEIKKEDKVAAKTDKLIANDTESKIAADVVDQHGREKQAQIDANGWEQPSTNLGFFERYQILIACALMLVTALSIIIAVGTQKRRDKKDEIRAVAAALRGELMAARGVCLGKIKAITTEIDDTATTWPRIRVTLYQAYVGRLGLLGAELARQIASIYGQSSDYASFYNASAGASDLPKKQALESLSRNIDEILPKLATIEQTGALPTSSNYYPSEAYNPRAPQVAAPLISKRLPPATLTVAPRAPEAIRKKAVPEIAAQKTEPRPPKEAVAEKLVSIRDETETQPEAYDASGQKAPVALWEAVRGFIQNHRNAIASTPDSSDAQLDPHVAAYAAMIEADMARYHYTDSVDSFDKPRKKQS